MFRMGRPFLASRLLCADQSYYGGHTDDLEKRFFEHQQGGIGASTETRRPVRLVWSQECSTRPEAVAAELHIKNWNRAKQQALGRGDCDGLRKAAKKKDWVAYRQRRRPVCTRPSIRPLTGATRDERDGGRFS